MLGVLGLLFNKNHPELVGGTEDPKDGHQVAATCFVAVMIYTVGFSTSYKQTNILKKRGWEKLTILAGPGIPGILRSARVASHAGEPEGGDRVVVEDGQQTG